MIPEPPEIYKEVKILCNQHWGPEKLTYMLEKLWKDNGTLKMEWRDYRDSLHDVRIKNFEALAYFDSQAQRIIQGNGYYPIEKVALNDGDPKWWQLWDFDYWMKGDDIHSRKIYLPITIN